jgi:hypothetical protein
MSGKSNIQLNWHPDFRIKSTLPDTRVVRTNFIAKIVILAAILMVTAILLKREYQAYMLHQVVQNLEQQVQSASQADLARLKKSEQFRKLASNVIDLQSFFKVPFAPHDSIVALAKTKPEGLIFTRIILSELVVQVKVDKKTKLQVAFKLSISGNVQELPVLTQFKRELEESQLLNKSGYTASVSENIDQRNADTGIIPFQLSVLLEPVKNKTKAK